MLLSEDVAQLIFYLTGILIIILGPSYVLYKKRFRAVKERGTSVLLTYYTDTTNVLPLARGTFGDMHYTALLAVSSQPAITNNNNMALLYRVELPYASTSHLVGIPTQPEAIQLDPGRGDSLLERVTLEGNYEKYFTLFAARTMHSDTQYVLDPKAMVFTIDFCQSHSWEIVDNELYFVQSGNNAPNDPTLMANDVVRFVEEIRPAISRPLTRHQIQIRTPYKEERRNDIPCPVCSVPLKNEIYYLSCPNAHGTLVKGASLVAHAKGEQAIKDGIATPLAPPRPEPIICPACGHDMQHVNYNGSPIQIDSCTHCTYRWLDSGELAKIGILAAKLNHLSERH